MDDHSKSQVKRLVAQSPEYAAGFKAGREEGLREAAQIIMRKDNGGLTDQDAILSAIGGDK